MDSRLRVQILNEVIRVSRSDKYRNPHILSLPIGKNSSVDRSLALVLKTFREKENFECYSVAYLNELHTAINSKDTLYYIYKYSIAYK